MSKCSFLGEVLDTGSSSSEVDYLYTYMQQRKEQEGAKWGQKRSKIGENSIKIGPFWECCLLCQYL